MTNSTGADRVAGMWRPIEMSDGDILKLFQSGEHGERNYRQFDGEWYVLDESPEGLNAVKEHFRNEIIRELLDKYPDLSEEKIKDLAEEWITNNDSSSERFSSAIAGHLFGRKCFVAGHASRDHEVAELKRQRDELYESLCDIYEMVSCDAVKIPDELYKSVTHAANTLAAIESKGEANESVT